MDLPLPNLVAPRALAIVGLVLAAGLAAPVAQGLASRHLDRWAVEEQAFETRRTLARLAFQQGRFDSAAEEYRRLAEEFPDLPEVWRGLAQSCAELGQPARAEQAVSRAMDLTAAAGRPVPALDYVLRARARVEQGRVQEADQDLGRARVLAPYDLTVRMLNEDLAALRPAPRRKARRPLY